MKYIVHSATPVTAIVPARTDAGTVVEGQLPGLNVELVPLGGAGKTVTLEITAENWAGADPTDMFAQGNTVQLGFTLIEKASK